MAKQTGLGSRLWVGSANLSGDINAINRIAGGPAALDMTDITQSAFERKGGLRDGGIDVTSYFDPAAGASHAVYSALPRTDIITSAAVGATVGTPCASCQAVQVGYDGNRNNDGSYLLSVVSNADQYGVEWGELLTAGDRTDTTATASGTGLDGSAATTFGGQAYLHLSAFTGTSVTVKLQDSADNSSFSDISSAAFTAKTAVGWERIAFTGTVRRYVRVATTGTFSNAVFMVNFVRNATAVVF